MRLAMLSTIDNPYSPFDDYKAWYAWDTRAGYYSTEFLGRLTHLSNELSEADYNLAVEQAIDEIIEENVLGLYIKVIKEVEDIEQTS